MSEFRYLLPELLYVVCFYRDYMFELLGTGHKAGKHLIALIVFGLGRTMPFDCYAQLLIISRAGIYHIRT